MSTLLSSSSFNKIVVYADAFLSVYPHEVATFDIASVEIFGGLTTMGDATFAELLVDSGTIQTAIGLDATVTAGTVAFNQTKSMVANLNFIVETDLLVEGQGLVLDETTMTVNSYATYLSMAQIIMLGSSVYSISETSHHLIKDYIEFAADDDRSCLVEISGNISLAYGMVSTCMVSSTGRLEISGTNSTVRINQASGSLGEISTVSNRSRLVLTGTKTASLSPSSSLAAGTVIEVSGGKLIADVSRPSPFEAVSFVVDGGTLELEDTGGSSSTIPKVDILNSLNSELFINGAVTITELAMDGGLINGSTLTTTNLMISGGSLVNDGIVSEHMRITQDTTFRHGTFETSARFEFALATDVTVHLEDGATLILQETATMDVRGNTMLDTTTAGVFRNDGQITLFTPYTLDIGVQLIETSTGIRIHRQNSWLDLRAQSTLAKPTTYEDNSGVRFHVGSQTTVTDTATLNRQGGEWRVYWNAHVTSSAQALNLAALDLAGEFIQQGNSPIKFVLI